MRTKREECTKTDEYPRGIHAFLFNCKSFVDRAREEVDEHRAAERQRSEASRDAAPQAESDGEQRGEQEGERGERAGAQAADRRAKAGDALQRAEFREYREDLCPGHVTIKRHHQPGTSRPIGSAACPE